MDEPIQVRFRPRRLRLVAWVGAAVVLLASVGLAVALSGRPAGNAAMAFGTADRVGMVGLGVIGAVALLTLTRPLVAADDEGIWVRNVVGSHRLPWAVVRAVRFDHGAAWASLELADDDTVPVLAVQAVDKQHAVAAVRALRARHAAYQQRSAAGQS